MAGSSHHLSVLSVRSLILARVGEKTPDITTPLLQRFGQLGPLHLWGKCALIEQKYPYQLSSMRYELNHKKRTRPTAPKFGREAGSFLYRGGRGI